MKFTQALIAVVVLATVASAIPLRGADESIEQKLLQGAEAPLAQANVEVAAAAGDRVNRKLVCAHGTYKRYLIGGGYKCKSTGCHDACTYCDGNIKHTNSAQCASYQGKQIQENIELKLKNLHPNAGALMTVVVH